MFSFFIIPDEELSLKALEREMLAKMGKNELITENDRTELKKWKLRVAEPTVIPPSPAESLLILPGLIEQ